MSNELLQEQTSKEPQALLPQVNKAIYGVDAYKDKLVHVSLPHFSHRWNMFGSTVVGISLLIKWATAIS